MMRLNRSRGLLLACALLPLTARGEEDLIEPVWEFQARSGGETSSVFSRSIEELFGKTIPTQISTRGTVLRVAGFENDKTPDKDWIAEIRGIKGIEKILPADKLGAQCAAWSDDAETLLLAGPAVNKGQTIKEMIVLGDSDWLSGWIDFDQLNNTNIQSKLLKLPKNLSFTLTGTDDVVVVTLRPRFDSVSTATAVLAWLTQVSELLQKAKVNLPKPPTVCKVEGAVVTVSMEFQREDFKQLCAALKKVIAKKDGENSPDQGH